MDRRIFYTLPTLATLPKIIAEGKLQKAQSHHMETIEIWLKNFYKEALNEATMPKLKKSNKQNNKENVIMYIWEKEKTPIAMGAVHINLNNARLNLIYTNKNFRAKGYGKAIVISICQIARDMGKVPVLYTTESNVNAIKLYEGIGFVKTREN